MTRGSGSCSLTACPLVSDAAIIVGEHVAKTPRQRAVVSGMVLSTYSAALALLVHGLRDEPRTVKPGVA